MSEPDHYSDEFWEKFARFYNLATKFYLLPFGGEGSFRNEIIKFGQPKAGEQILDVCCGTGTLTMRIAEKVGQQAGVTGIDTSQEMIRIATKKAVKKKLSIKFELASGKSLPFLDNYFDRSFVSLCLHELPNDLRIKVLQEIQRVLKINGYLVVIDFNLSQKLLPRLMIKMFVKFIEKEVAYNFLLKELLGTEIAELGFKLVDKKLILLDMFQLLLFQKS
ncbi:MAG: class I SAM-dependent methyltransferase [Dehalococcoidia bacterium]|nr:MAG: class I SAM-dependent methyltransferase [Dehalococcoidia bacterium]